MESEKKNQLDNLLLSYNVTNIINFPTRVQNTSATAIDNIFMGFDILLTISIYLS